MSLTDTVKEVIEDFDKRKNKQGVWEALEKRMKKEDLKWRYERLIHEIDTLKAYKILKVWDAFDEHLNKKKLGLGSHARRTFDELEELSEIECIEEVIKTLADSGFEMPSYKDIFTYAPGLEHEHTKFFEALAKDELYKKYGPLSRALSKLGYKGLNNYPKSRQNPLDHFTNIISLKGDVAGAVYVLAANGYKIDESAGLDCLDIKSIKRIIAEDEKETSEGKGGIPIYLYNTGNLEIFQDYFNNLEAEKKKSALKPILDYEINRGQDRLIESSDKKQNREWLEKNHESLLREVGFEDVK